MISANNSDYAKMLGNISDSISATAKVLVFRVTLVLVLAVLFTRTKMRNSNGKYITFYT